MELKLRRKGEVVIVDGFPKESIPSAIPVPEGLEGIDLTGYSVIQFTGGRHARERAKELHAKAPGTIVVFKYDYNQGWGEGILLPDHFNPSRVRFYRSAEQVEAARKAAAKQAAQRLCQEIEAAIPGVHARLDWKDEGVEVTPVQEVFCTDGWQVRPASLEEAKRLVAEMLPVWKEWNERGLEIYLRYRPNPGNGNVQLHHSPTCHEKVAVKCAEKSFTSGSDDSLWVILRKGPDSSWAEDGTTNSLTLQYRL